MAHMSGLVLPQRLNALGARIPIIVPTGHGDVPMAVQAMKAGAVDFIQKPYRDQALLDSINAALCMDAAGRRSTADADSFNQSHAALTEREREVLDHLLVGRANKEIARELAISQRTVDTKARDISGPERLARLKATCARLPVLLLVDRGDVPTAVRAIRVGTLDVLEKPLRDGCPLECIKMAAAVGKDASANG
jgi:FixJ family two-component response regulator